MKVAFLDTVHDILDQELQKFGFTTFHWEDQSEEWIHDNIHEMNGIVIRSRFPMNKDFLSHAKELKFIARSGAGMENIDLDYCLDHKIQCFNAPEGNRNAVAEHALGMLLSLFNKMCKGNSEIRAGEWNREDNRGIELDGKTVGIIGYGNNGSAFVKKLRGFDVEVLAYDKYVSGFGDGFVHEASLEDVFEKADVLSLHIPLTHETDGMINTEFWANFKKPIYFINLSRGPIVKTKDLVAALKSKQVLGACLDVLEHEKSSFENFYKSQSIPEDLKELLAMDNVLVSPHVGGWTEESYYKLSKVLADKILLAYGQQGN